MANKFSSLIKFIIIIYSSFFAANCISVELFSDTYRPEFRSANEILLKIRPSLSRDSKVSVASGMIILKATRSDIIRMRNLFEEIDRPLRTYLVTLSNKKNIEKHSNSYQIKGLVPVSKQGSINFKGQSELDSNAKYIKSHPEATLSSNMTKALEDTAGFIAYGPDVKARIVNSILDENGNKIKEEVVYKIFRQGFFITIKRIGGDKLILDMSPFFGGGGQFLQNHQDEVMTSIYCKRGSWIKVDFTKVAYDQNYSEATLPDDIWIKVDEL